MIGYMANASMREHEGVTAVEYGDGEEDEGEEEEMDEGEEMEDEDIRVVTWPEGAVADRFAAPAAAVAAAAEDDNSTYDEFVTPSRSLHRASDVDIDAITA